MEDRIRSTWNDAVCGVLPSARVFDWVGRLTSIYDRQGPGANIAVDISQSGHAGFAVLVYSIPVNFLILHSPG